jgi:hypothetical protein
MSIFLKETCFEIVYTFFYKRFRILTFEYFPHISRFIISNTMFVYYGRHSDYLLPWFFRKQTGCVYRAVRTESLNVIHINF